MKLKATIELWQKGKWCVAKVPELDFVAQGLTIEEAKANLIEVINIQFTEMRKWGCLKITLPNAGLSSGTIPLSRRTKS